MADEPKANLCEDCRRLRQALKVLLNVQYSLPLAEPSTEHKVAMKFATRTLKRTKKCETLKSQD